MNLDIDIIKGIKKNKELPFFYFKKFNNEKYLLTNEVGEYFFLEPIDFQAYLNGKLKRGTKLYSELLEKGFIKNSKYIEEISQKYIKKYAFLQKPTNLHIIVITLRCNHKCLYCHASAESEKNDYFDMTKEVAQKTIDLIFSAPSKDIIIEFQGGEPLINWDILKFAIGYSLQLAAQSDKKVKISVVSNFTLLTEDKLDFLQENGVNLCTSIDGSEKIHNANRIWFNGNSFQEVTKWFREIRKRVRKERQKGNYNLNNPGALLTITRPALIKYKEIIDTYVSLGIKQIFLRPLNPIGYAKNAWSKIGYSTDEFVEFYKNAMEYILEINRKNYRLVEKFSSIKLRKILTNEDPNFLDDRSPCGGGVGQIAYNYNGDVFTCDEGRMIAQEGEDVFKIGNVFKHSWNDLMESFTTKSICSFSCNSGYAGLASHVYKPYIGICPAYNYSLTGQMHPNFYESDYFRRHEAILDYLFEKIQDDKSKEIFLTWINYPQKKINKE